MTLISDFLAVVALLPRPLLILVTGALVLGECTLGIGFLVPGESGLLIASAAVTDVGFFFVLSGTVALCAVVLLLADGRRTRTAVEPVPDGNPRPAVVSGPWLVEPGRPRAA